MPTKRRKGLTRKLRATRRERGPRRMQSPRRTRRSQTMMPQVRLSDTEVVNLTGALALSLLLEG